VTAQFAIADWVKSRGLAMYQIAFFGSLALGSILWGQIAAATSVATTLLIAAAALALSGLTAAKFKLEGARALDLQPALNWPEPRVLLTDTSNRGVILTTVEYEIDSVDTGVFLQAIKELERTRRRNGAYECGIYEDMEKPGRFVEHFLTDSWLDHLRQHNRTTVADRAIQDRVKTFHKGAAPPHVTHFAAPGERTGDSRSQ
jgi:hypothetical protein